MTYRPGIEDARAIFPAHIFVVHKDGVDLGFPKTMLVDVGHSYDRFGIVSCGI